MKFTQEAAAMQNGYALVSSITTRRAEYDKSSNTPTGKFLGGRVTILNCEMEEIVVNLPHEVTEYKPDDRDALQAQGILLCARFTGFESSKYTRAVGSKTIYYAAAETVEFKAFSLKEVAKNG